MKSPTATNSSSPRPTCCGTASTSTCTRQEVLAIDREQRFVTVKRLDSGETYTQTYDRLILSPGASPFVPPIDGAPAPNVLTLRNIPDTDAIKAQVDRDGTESAVVVGAGFIGLEMVEQLVHRGVKTTLVELQPQVLPLLDAEMAQPLAEELRRHGVAMHLGTGIERIVTSANGRAESVELADGTSLAADLVILGIGVRPNTKLAVEAGLEIGRSGGIATNDFMQTSDPSIYAVGDVAEYPYGPTAGRQRIALAGPANRSGRLAGEHAATGRSAKMASVMGTSVVRVFGITAAMTGLTMSLAGRLKQSARAVTIIAGHHAGYYPGAEALTLKLVYEPETSRVLGAQAVGGAGVDKRIDVIATAMHFGATVSDLAGLDLAYAPPYGSAKDPVHMAAFAASNDLRGIESFVEAGADLSGRQVVDVRTTMESSEAPLAGTESVNIPLDQLRERIGELDPKRPTVVSCAVGLRGHVASRILRQHGFNDVANLSGGAIQRTRAVEAQASRG
ncbi:MAG: FAD-dependent oxidoreductase [Pirellulales bacterium]